MNKFGKSIIRAALCAALMFIVAPVRAQTAPTKSGDEFFVVSSVDRTHNALILLAPTEIASVYQLTDKTQFFDENGKPLKLTDFRAGDTIFGSYLKKPDGTLVLERVRKGMMTVAELRRRYLPGLPADAGQTSKTPPKPKSNNAKSNQTSH